MMETVRIANFCLFSKLIIKEITSEFELMRILSIHVKIISYSTWNETNIN